MNSLFFIRLPQDTLKALSTLEARGNNLFQGSLKKKIFYVHIPKCGGASVRRAIKDCYLTFDITKDRHLVRLLAGESFRTGQIIADRTEFASDTTDDYSVLKFREELLIYYMSQEPIRYIAGHFTFSAAAHRHFADKFNFVTILRDPVKRWLSAYYFNRYKDARRKHRRIEVELEAFLETDFARSQGHECVKFLGGLDPSGDYTSERAVNRAIESLHKFHVVGVLEYLDDFEQKFEQRFGRKISVGIRNQSPKPKSANNSVITEEIKAKIRELCQPDIEVYQYALRNLVNTKK